MQCILILLGSKSSPSNFVFVLFLVIVYVSYVFQSTSMFKTKSSKNFPFSLPSPPVNIFSLIPFVPKLAEKASVLDLHVELGHCFWHIPSFSFQAY